MNITDPSITDPKEKSKILKIKLEYLLELKTFCTLLREERVGVSEFINSQIQTIMSELILQI